MEWAVGEKELKYYPEGEHVCANYLDETDAYTIDWLKKHLMASWTDRLCQYLITLINLIFGGNLLSSCDMSLYDEILGLLPLNEIWAEITVQKERIEIAWNPITVWSASRSALDSAIW